MGVFLTALILPLARKAMDCRHFFCFVFKAGIGDYVSAPMFASALSRVPGLGGNLLGLLDNVGNVAPPDALA